MMMLRLSRRTHLDCSASDTPTTEHTHPSTAWQWKNVLDFYFFLPHFSLAVRSPTWAVLPVLPSGHRAPHWRAGHQRQPSWSPQRAATACSPCYHTQRISFWPFHAQIWGHLNDLFGFLFFPFSMPAGGIIVPCNNRWAGQPRVQCPSRRVPCCPCTPCPCPCKQTKAALTDLSLTTPALAIHSAIGLLDPSVPPPPLPPFNCTLATWKLHHGSASQFVKDKEMLLVLSFALHWYISVLVDIYCFNLPLNKLTIIALRAPVMLSARSVSWTFVVVNYFVIKSYHQKWSLGVIIKGDHQLDQPALPNRDESRLASSLQKRAWLLFLIIRILLGFGLDFKRFWTLFLVTVNLPAS